MCEHSFDSLPSNYTQLRLILLHEFSTMDLCMSCSNPVRPRQEGLQCDGCNRWQHRTCHTGISRETYRAAVQSGQTIDWFCDQCNQPVAESTRLDEDLESTIYDQPLVSYLLILLFLLSYPI